MSGYTDRLSYQAGDVVTVCASSPQAEVHVDLVRLVAALGPDGQMHEEPEPVPWSEAGSYPTASQETCIGSFAVGIDPLPSHGAQEYTIGSWIWPTRLDRAGTQSIVNVEGTDGRSVTLGVEHGRAVLILQDGDQETRVQVDTPFNERQWHFVRAVVSAEEARIVVSPLDPLYGVAAQAQVNLSAPVPLPGSGTVCLAAAGAEDVETVGGVVRGRARDHFNGKIEAPFILAGALPAEVDERLARGETALLGSLGEAVLAAWDMALHQGDDFNVVRSYRQTGGPARLVNVPTRAVTGLHWTGRELAFHAAPEQYAAVHFHDSDIADMGWTPTLSAPLPQTLSSGVYGVRLSAGGKTDTLPVVVLPAPDRPRADVVVLLPTFCYLAYANERQFEGETANSMRDGEIHPSEADLARSQNTLYGLSMYDHHPDGSGVTFSAARRPILNMRHDYANWLVEAGRAFSSDMYLIEWLERRGVAYDVITDLELHEQGIEALKPYGVVITGSHPEYYSERMLDSMTEFRDSGGSIMYLGGNGFYWVTEVYSHDPLVVEVRRGHAGVRSWESLPGEAYVLTTGQPGGLWRHRGRAPQKLVGVGFTGQGFGSARPYHLSEAAHRPDLKWILEGVDEDPVGDYGRVMGGAAGDELDRADISLGTPPDAVVLASSRNHTNYYQRVVEEIVMGLPDHHGGMQDPLVRSDIVYFKCPGGGQVFSVGSIAWSGALLVNDHENGISRMTENVLRRFITGD
ncbi:N,N-dimethylformamidase beta subunit family domain-containing protein [Streptomyces sp. NPDC000880]